MTLQQANFVKELVDNKESLNSIAEKFYLRYNKTEYCSGPSGFYIVKGKKISQYSALDGNDIKNAASMKLNIRL